MTTVKSIIQLHKMIPDPEGGYYVEVFKNKYGFIPNLSILDVLFNLGPETKSYLNNVKIDLN